VNEHVWHLYVVRVPDRDRVLSELGAAEIGAAIHYPNPIHMTEAFADLGMPAGSFPNAERAAPMLLTLPLHPHITAEQQERVVDALGKAFQ
jgi:dTDP-4-amino-4,6-dideoxygalactose transaminase